MYWGEIKAKPVIEQKILLKRLKEKSEQKSYWHDINERRQER